MGLSKLFSLNPSQETEKSQNEDIALEIADKLSNLLDDFDNDYEECIPIINESLRQLARKDKELSLAILKVLKEKHSEIDKKFPFTINP